MNQSQAMAVRGTRGRGAQVRHAARIALLAFTTLPAYGALWLMPQAALQRALPAALAGQVTEAATSGAVVQVHELPGMTRELYEQATSALGLPGPPPGSHLHASGPTDSGWRIVEVWASEAAANAFYGSAQFQQTTQRLGLPRPAITSYPVERVALSAAGQVMEAAASGAVVQVHELPGMTRELYEQATSALGLPGPPPGSHLHASGPTDSGWRIVEVWASEAAANAFYGSAQFQQTTQRLGLPQPAISSYPVETVKVASPVALPDTGTSTLLQSHGALVAGAALLLLIGMLTVRRMAPRS